jgi:predicted nucleotidyltransferase
MQPSIEQYRVEIALLCHRYAVRRLEVFGSAARGADFVVDLDSDSGLPLLEQFFRLADALRQLAGRPVDQVVSGAV